jgi:DNA polymerase III subunit beta
VELTIGKQELIKALGRVQGILEKTGDSILSQVKLEAIDNKLRITASGSQSISIIANYEDTVQISEEGSICVKGYRLFSIAKALSDDATILKFDKNPTNKESNIQTPQLHIRNGRANFKIVECKRADEYPPIGKVDVLTGIKISNANLKRMLDETSFSIASNERPGLNGTRLERIIQGVDTYLRMVTSDGNRLSISQSEFDGILDSDIDLIFESTLLPKKAVVEIRKICEEGEEDWSISFGEREAVFTKNHITVTVAMISGQFPEYQQLLNNMNTFNKAIIDRKKIIDSFRRVSIFISQANQSVRFSFSADDKLLITAKNPDSGSFDEGLSIDYDGNAIKFAFNLHFFQEVLGALNSDEIILNLGNAESDACLITVPNREDCKFVIMPMKMA